MFDVKIFLMITNLIFSACQILVRKTKLLLIGGDYHNVHDKVYIYDPTVNPNAIQPALPNALKFSQIFLILRFKMKIPVITESAAYQCTDPNLHQIGYGVLCTAGYKKEVQ